MKDYVNWTTPVMLTLVLALCLPAGAGATTVTLQPGPEGKDTYVRTQTNKPERAGWNFGGDIYMQVRSDYYDSLRTHCYVQFELPTIDPDNVARVGLSLLSYLDNPHVNTSTMRDISVYKVTADWVEGSGIWGVPTNPGDITYNNQPAFDPTPLATINVPAGITEEEEAAGGVWHVWDSDDAGNAGLMNLVKEWLSGTTTNYGLMVRLTEPDNTSGRPYHNYYSSDYMDDGTLRPKLEISDTGSVTIPGDANENGIVDDEDASILAAHWQYGPNAVWGDGDFNDDGYVNDQDASILAAHWLQTQEGNNAPVPEPSVVVLLLGVGLIGLLARARRRR